MYKVILLLIMLVQLQFGFAQSKWNYGHTDSVTYRLYKKQSWAKLIRVSNYALDAQTDFYFLRVRRGIAFYELQNYRASTTEFHKALKFFPIDTFSKRMLYHSYLLQGDVLTARKMAAGLSEETKDWIGYHKTALQEIGLYTGLSTYNLETQLQQFVRNDTATIADISGSKSLRMAGFYLKHRIKNSIEFTHVISACTVKSYHYINNNADTLKYINSGYQFGYALNAEINLKQQFRLLPTVQFTHTKGEDWHRYLKDTIIWVPAGPPHPKGSLVAKQITIPDDKSTAVITNFIQVGMGAKKQYKNFEFLAKAYYAFDDTSTVIQASLGSSWYPHGNYTTYLTAAVSMTNYFKENNLVVQAKAGQKLMKVLWLEMAYTYGNTQYYTHPSLNTIYLTSDRTRQAANVNLIVFLPSHIKINLSYDYSQRLAIYRIIPNKANSGPPFKTAYTYYSQQFLITTSWTF